VKYSVDNKKTDYSRILLLSPMTSASKSSADLNNSALNRLIGTSAGIILISHGRVSMVLKEPIVFGNLHMEIQEKKNINSCEMIGPRQLGLEVV
jgi:hypothetical protein